MFNSEIIVPIFNLNEMFVVYNVDTGDLVHPDAIPNVLASDRWISFCTSNGTPAFLYCDGGVVDLCGAIPPTELHVLSDIRKDATRWLMTYRAAFERTLNEIRRTQTVETSSERTGCVQFHPDYINKLENLQRAIAPGSDTKFSVRGMLAKQVMRQVISNENLPDLIRLAYIQATAICALQTYIARLRTIEIAMASPCIVKNGRDLYPLLIQD